MISKFATMYQDQSILFQKPFKKRKAERGEALEFLEATCGYSGNKCILWPFGTISNYGIVILDYTPVTCHILVCEIVHGLKLNTSYVTQHSCKNKLCLTPAHIGWVHRSELIGPEFRACGENMHLAKLTEKDVKEIRASNSTLRVLAKEYGVDRSTVGSVRRRKTWKHI